MGNFRLHFFNFPDSKDQNQNYLTTPRIYEFRSFCYPTLLIIFHFVWVRNDHLIFAVAVLFPITAIILLLSTSHRAITFLLHICFFVSNAKWAQFLNTAPNPMNLFIILNLTIRNKKQRAKKRNRDMNHGVAPILLITLTIISCLGLNMRLRFRGHFFHSTLFILPTNHKIIFLN